MFINISGKIKTLAVVLTVLGTLTSLFCGLNILDHVEGLLGILVIVFGTLWSWISSFLLYGFGELIDRVCGIHEMIDWKLQQEFVQEQSKE